MKQITNALISVYNKKNLEGFARGLSEECINIISTGGTAEILEKAGNIINFDGKFHQAKTSYGPSKTNRYGQEKKGSALLCGENRVLVMISYF